MKRAKIRRPDAIKLLESRRSTRAATTFLKLMDAELAKRDWLALGAPTIADISCFGPISMLKVSGYDTDKWPNVTRWLERIKALPGAHDIDGNSVRRDADGDLERAFGLDDELHVVDRRIAVQREREIDVHDDAAARSAASSGVSPTPTSESVPKLGVARGSRPLTRPTSMNTA